MPIAVQIPVAAIILRSTPSACEKVTRGFVEARVVV